MEWILFHGVSHVGPRMNKTDDDSGEGLLYFFLFLAATERAIDTRGVQRVDHHSIHSIISESKKRFINRCLNLLKVCFALILGGDKEGCTSRDVSMLIVVFAYVCYRIKSLAGSFLWRTSVSERWTSPGNL